MRIPKALTVAGSDSSGGAGVEADIKTFATLGVHGLTAITLVTAQDTEGVKLIHNLPPDVVAAQIDAVVKDPGVDAVKTGALGTEEVVEVVAERVRRYGLKLVVDPLIKASDGSPLLSGNAVRKLINELIPLAKVVTPNAFEAEELTGVRVRSVEDARRAAKALVEELGVEAAVVKGGHIEGGGLSIDVLYYNGEFTELKSPRIGIDAHGTGCVFSAAVAACLAKGLGIKESVRIAKEVVTDSIKYCLRLGRGRPLSNPTSRLEVKAFRWEAINSVMNALEIVEREGELINPLIPEVQMNIVTSIPKPYASSINDVAGVKGRVVRYGNTVRAVGPPCFGASKHLARAVLKVMEFNPDVRGAVNIRYSKEFIDAAMKLGLKVSWYDRREEPEEVKGVEGRSIPWGIEVAIKRLGGVPDIIYHKGDVGKEPMINIFGIDAVDAVRKLVRVARLIRHGR